MKMRKSKLTQMEIVKLYVDELKTMQEIAGIAGISRAAVSNCIKDSGVDYRGGMIKTRCKECGAVFNVRRGQIKGGMGLYCSTDCYHSARILNPEAYERITDILAHNGRSEARRVMNAKGKQVVHHEDGDPTNNDITNLRKFRSHAHHMRYHAELRRKKVK